ncbi:MAG: cytochrome c3 family protein [Acidobacteriia bacterium]|nr:cytochrome c3 family protein [Terriglobia bacterium]
MPGAERTTKKLAQRIDLNYFKHPHPFRRWRFWLSVSVPLIAVLWLAWYGLTGNKRVYSGGKMSPAHVVLTAKCDACHFKLAGFFSAKASDRVCLSCHDGPIHHANQTFTPKCSSCHMEHRGQLRLAATSDASCTQCHANLRTVGAETHFARDVEDFGAGHHPEFAAVRTGSVDPGTIKLNHAVHLKKNLAGSNGPVQLDCDDCHRPPTSTDAWRFGSAPPNAAPAAQKSDLPAMSKSDLPLMVSARAYMAPITYAKHCAACHGLQFDKRFTEGVPHDTPEIVHAFVVQKFQQYIVTHPAELRETALDRNLAQKPLPVPVRVLTPPQWVAGRVGEAEELLWRKTCKQCHALSVSVGAALPTVAKSNIPARWFPHANFNHERHRLAKCSECHAAPKSQETSDILVPGVHTCERCHHAGAESAESRCFECHTYHDWTKAKEVKGGITFSGLVRDN